MNQDALLRVGLLTRRPVAIEPDHIGTNRGMHTFSWPSSALVMLGIFIGASLLFNGAVLPAIGWLLRKG